MSQLRVCHQLVFLIAVAAAGFVQADNEAARKPIVFNDNGGWCWFQDQRVIARDGVLLIGSVADGSGSGGAERDGNIELVVYDVARGVGTRQVLSPGLRPADDHNSPALLALPDGRTIAVYSRHGQDRLMRWRISAVGDPTTWSQEQTADLGAAVTYSNVFRLADENGRLYNFHRGRGYDPNIAISEDSGNSWTYFAHLLENPNDPNDRIRPYLKYASNGRDVIHFVATEAHPQEATATSLYHGFLRAGKIYGSDGALVKDLKEGAANPTSLTRVFAGDPDHRAWPCDLELDQANHPVAVYSVHLTDDDHRYRYARWDGKRWNDHEIAFAGSNLYPRERHYTGLAALDPNHLDTVYISANVDPVSGSTLVSAGDGKRHYEIFKGRTSDGGGTWTWTPVTEDSSMDNIRPVVPAWDGKRTAVLWLRGTYTSYTDYDLDVVGFIEDSSSLAAPGEPPSGTSWISLFDGKSLDGWTVKCKPEDQSKGFWKVEQGAILADSIGQKDHDYVWLVTNREYSNFLLRLEFQAFRASPGNSGVQIRSRYDDDAFWLNGPQIDINPPGAWRTGMMWDETRGNQRWIYPDLPKDKWVDESMANPSRIMYYAEDGDRWNLLEISAMGTQIKATLNGVPITDYDGKGLLDDPLHHDKRVGMEGFIALQIHTGDQLKIRFRNIRIKPLY